MRINRNLNSLIYIKDIKHGMKNFASLVTREKQNKTKIISRHTH